VNTPRTRDEFEVENIPSRAAILRQQRFQDRKQELRAALQKEEMPESARGRDPKPAAPVREQALSGSRLPASARARLGTPSSVDRYRRNAEPPPIAYRAVRRKGEDQSRSYREINPKATDLPSEPAPVERPWPVKDVEPHQSRDLASSPLRRGHEKESPQHFPAAGQADQPHLPRKNPRQEPPLAHRFSAQTSSPFTRARLVQNARLIRESEPVSKRGIRARQTTEDLTSPARPDHEPKQRSSAPRHQLEAKPVRPRSANRLAHEVEFPPEPSWKEEADETHPKQMPSRLHEHREQLRLRDTADGSEQAIEHPRKRLRWSEEDVQTRRKTALQRVTEVEPSSAQSERVLLRDTVDEEPCLEDPDDQLPPLKVLGGFIADENGNAVSLRGVTVLGLDTSVPAAAQCFRAALALDDTNLSLLLELWGVSVVRLVFQARSLLTGSSSLSSAQLLSGLDEIVGAVTAAGAYVLLAMTPAAGSAGLAPGDDTFQAWELLAEHYQNAAGVLYELLAPTIPSPVNWLDMAPVLVGTIRQKQPGALIFLGKGVGGSEVSGLPLRFSTGAPVFNLVYTIQVSASGSSNLDDGELQALAHSHPVFASAWFDDGAGFDRLAGSVAGFLERNGIGWAAANWNADSRLVADAANHDFTPTGWGLVVQRALRLPVRPLLQSFAPAPATITG